MHDNPIEYIDISIADLKLFWFDSVVAVWLVDVHSRQAGLDQF